MSISKSGKNNPNYGKPMKESIRKKISKANKGFKHTNESKEKISQAKTGFKHTDESKRKMSIKHMGMVFSETAKENMRKAQVKFNGKPILMLDKNTEELLIRFECISDAHRYIGKGFISDITRVLKGKRKTAYGYKWKYDGNTNKGDK